MQYFPFPSLDFSEGSQTVDYQVIHRISGEDKNYEEIFQE